jgi:murein DD-endopeptidase MepM/ murein hydrolase activator NlpD
VRGTVLAEMGSTGNSTGPHVDYQVWDNGANKNPMDYLR